MSEPIPRLFTQLHSSSAARLFHTKAPLPCTEDPELWFNYRWWRRAAMQCAECPFLGRCAHNAVTVGATHGVWAGVLLPGAYADRLAPVYAQFRQLFNERRDAELGSGVAPLAGPAVTVKPLRSFRCARCRATFTAKRCDAKYCGESCRVKAGRARRRQAAD